MKSRCILAGATLALASAVAVAQSTAKPSAYEGVSEPPATDVIRSTEAPAAIPSATTTATVAPAPNAKSASVKPAQAPQAAPVENPDYGIVEVPVTTEPAAPAQAPNLQNRPSDPDADIVTSVQLPDNALVQGTAIHTRLNRQLSSEEDGVGTRFTAQVIRDVVQSGRVIIPIGSVVHGKVMHADYGRRIAGQASLRLLADEVVLPDGTRYNMSALPSQTGTSTRTRVNAEGAILTKDNPRKIAAEYLLGSGGGAATGAVLGGPTGAVVGTAIGAGAVTAHVLLNRQAAVLPAGSPLTFGLKQNMQLTPITTSAMK